MEYGNTTLDCIHLSLNSMKVRIEYGRGRMTKIETAEEWLVSAKARHTHAISCPARQMFIFESLQSTYKMQLVRQPHLYLHFFPSYQVEPFTRPTT